MHKTLGTKRLSNLPEAAELHPEAPLSYITMAIIEVCAGSDSVRYRWQGHMVVGESRNWERLHATSDLGLSFKTIKTGLKIIPYSGAFCSHG